MASAFAAQLRTIAQNSTRELDLRARRDAHAESLIFPKATAAKQDFESIFTICSEGFRDLCSLDASFAEFERNLFSPQSIRTEREQMNKSGNETLDMVLEKCLAMLSSKLLLKPGVKCLEWLVRRFRVHVNNTTALLLSVLPWHEATIWRNVFSLIPKDKCTGAWKFLGLYKQEAMSIPRTAIVYAASNNDAFFTLFNKHAIDTSRDGISYAALLTFWTGIVVEAVLRRLDAAKSGRKEVQKQRTEDVLLIVLPLLSDGFDVRGCPDLTTTCLTLAMSLADKANLEDRVLDSLLHTISTTMQHLEADAKATVITVAAIISQKQTGTVPKSTLEVFMNMDNLETILSEMDHLLALNPLFESLLTAALSNTKKKHIEKRLALVEKLLHFSSILKHDRLASSATEILLARINKLRLDDNSSDSFGNRTLELVLRLLDEQKFRLAESKSNQKQLELLFDQQPTQLEALPDTAEVNLAMRTHSTIEEMCQKMPSLAADIPFSFLQPDSQHYYTQLLEGFVACSKSLGDLERFTQLPFWHSAQTGLRLESFLLRVAIGSLSSSQRTAALVLLKTNLGAKEALDLQAFLPFILTTLSDTATSVRKAAVELLVAIEKVTVDSESLGEVDASRPYDDHQLGHVKEVSASHLQKIIQQVLLPALEEFVLDASQISQTVRLAINGPHGAIQTSPRVAHTELKKSLRHDLCQLLVGRSIAIPFYKVKINTINLLRDTNKIGTSTKSEMLEPLFRDWVLLDERRAQQLAGAEALTLAEIDAVIVEIISAQDRDAVRRALDILTGADPIPRNELIVAVFGRIQRLWKDLKHDVQITTAQRMFELAFTDHPAFARGAQDILRSVRLSTDILGSLLESSANGIASVNNDEQQQPKKKRRTSHGQDSLPPNQAQLMKAAASRLTLALEVVDDSRPEERPELMPALFDILTTLKRFKQQQPYLLNLCLSGILAIVDTQKSLPTQKIDTSSIRPDLVTECIRSSENTQVQTTALLLSASLASIAPDRILHSVMPIFTFMGQNMFSKEDEHSIYVIDQAIDQIIPILVQSLKSQNRDLVKSTSGLLASFTAAYDHIPQPRRVAIYSRLLKRMGADEFAFILFAMLSSKKAALPSFSSFFTDLLAETSISTQIITFQKSVDLANDLVLPQPHFADEIFGFTQTTDSHERLGVAKTVLKTALSILSFDKLKTQFDRIHKLNLDTSQLLMNHFDASLRLILVTIRDRRRDGHHTVEEAKRCLDALLALPAPAELFGILPQALTHMDAEEGLKPQILRVVAAQVHNKPVKDTRTRIAAMDLLVHLTDMLVTDIDATTKQAIVVCIDQISETYGRKDPERVLAAANAIASDRCIGTDNTRLATMSLLCLASMIEVLKEACIPIVPEIMQKIIEFLRSTTHEGTEDEELHGATYALIAAIATHVPFLLSDDDLQALLVLSFLSATKYKSSSAAGSRVEALSIIARKIDLQSLLHALLGETLNASREYPEDAEIEILDMLSASLETATKANVTKNADLVSQVLLAHLDQRNRLCTSNVALDESIAEVLNSLEHKINDVSVIFIYKLNDTVFRPLFESWVDWATNAYDIEDSNDTTMAKVLRQTALFNLFTHFFDSLKSIVTSYASYIIAPSSTILSAMANLSESKGQHLSPEDTVLYRTLLKMLQVTFTHDADGFFTAPSRFEPIGPLLVKQLKFAASKIHRQVVYDYVVPTIVSLATATLDTPAHHQSLSHELVQLRHSSSAAVRLASIKTLATMTDDENVSEEFIANVIGIGSGEGEGARGVGGGGSVGEVMIYVNEMLEDDDEEVEREVRKWVQSVREKTGEDIFEV